MANHAFTGCLDRNGKAIHFGDTIAIEVSEQNPIFSTIEPTRHIFRIARKRTDGKFGFEIPMGKGCLYWDVDGTPCHEVTVL